MPCVQSIIPLTLFFSKIILRKRYVLKQIVGAVLVVLGILISLLPVLIDLVTGRADTELESGWWWPLMYVCSLALRRAVSIHVQVGRWCVKGLTRFLLSIAVVCFPFRQFGAGNSARCAYEHP